MVWGAIERVIAAVSGPAIASIRFKENLKFKNALCAGRKIAMQRKPLIATVSLFSLSMLLAGCSTAPRTTAGRQDLHDQVVAQLNDYKRTAPDLQNLLDNSAGYAMFPDVGKGAVVVGAAYGHGEVFSHGRSLGWADIRLGSVGAQVGGQEYSELIVFKTQDALDRFRNNQFTFGANATAVALTSGAAATPEFTNGVAVFTKTEGGLMAEASLSGQEFTFTPRGAEPRQAGYSQNEAPTQSQ